MVRFLVFVTALLTVFQIQALEIPVTDRPSYIAVNTATHQALIGYKKSKTLDLFNLNNNTTVATILLNERSSGMAIDPASNLAVISHEKNDRVSFVDLSNGTVLGSLDVGESPQGLALDSTRRLAVVANKKDDTVSLIHIDDRTLVATISVGQAPTFVAINDVTGIALVTNKDDDSISVLNLVSKSVVTTIPVGQRPGEVVVDAQLNRAAVVHPKDDSVSIIDIVSNTVLLTLPVGIKPSGIALNPDTHEVLVSSEEDNNVTLIDLQTMSVIESIATGTNPTGVAIDSGINKAAVTNEDSNSISIIVLENTPIVDTQSPVINQLQDILVDATSANGASVTYNLPVATDNLDPNPSVTCSPSSGSLFALGNTPVNCTATDAAGNVAQGAFEVIVQDTTAPVLSALQDIIVDAADVQGATVTYALPTASDSVEPHPAVNCQPVSGGVFSIGIHTVSCSAMDNAANQSQSSFTITVNTLVPDLPAPLVLSPADKVVEANAVTTAINIGVATATDAGGNVLPVSNNAPAEFPLGTTTVTHAATDQAGNIGRASHTVTVQDTTPPQLTAPPGITASAPDGNPLTLNLGKATATDIFLVTITHNAPVQFPLGTTIIQWAAVDSSGNSAVATQTVNVTAPTPPATPNPTEPVVLPPDPGSEGDLTLAGIDSDNDGVRDDVQRWIALTYPNSARIRTLLTQNAKTKQKFLQDASDPLLSLQHARENFRVVSCGTYLLLKEGWTFEKKREITIGLKAAVFNTIERSRAWLLANSHLGGQVFTALPYDQKKQGCDFDPDILPN